MSNLRTHYEVSFKIEGRPHICAGDSNYPSKENYEKGDYFQDVVDKNIAKFISMYKKQNNVAGKENPHSVYYTIHFEEEKELNK